MVKIYDIYYANKKDVISKLGMVFGMAIIRVHDEIMEWYDLSALKDFLIINNIRYEDVEIISYSE